MPLADLFSFPHPTTESHTENEQRQTQDGCLLNRPPRPPYLLLILPRQVTFESPPGFSRARLLTAPAITLTPSTTAQSQQTWLPPPASARLPPQPTFSDFSLFEQAPTPTRASQPQPHRAPSLDLTLQRSFNTAQATVFHTQTDNLNSGVQANDYTRRLTRPPVPVPLFLPNSKGSIASQQNDIQHPQFNVTDFNAITMGGRVNVAYEGTFGDLTSHGNFNLDSFIHDTGVADSMPAPEFTAINGGTAAGNTVSPHEVFNDSMPPSTAFTNLTTPGSTFLETPDDDYQTSPLFTDNLETGNNNTYWPPLFDDADASAAAITSAPMMVRNSSSSSANQVVVHPGGESIARKCSSTTASPATFSPAARHSEVAGVGARKRDKPLPPIVVDENDPIALKRARNTAAARKSRAKRLAERDDLESEIARLKAQVEYWQGRARALGDMSVPDLE